MTEPEEPWRDLISDASRGDPIAMEALLEEHMPALHGFVRLQLGEVVAAKESSSDLVQSVCREILEDVGDFEFRGKAAFKKWLFKRALHKIIDRNRYYRRDKRDVAREARLPTAVTGEDAADLLGVYKNFCSPSREVVAQEEVQRVEAAFLDLPEMQREVILMSRMGGMSYAEIGERIEKTEIAVRGLVARGLARLAKLLQDSE